MALRDTAIDRLRQVAAWPEFASDRYEPIEEIGRGGMGTVYRALDRELGREVAIKIPNGNGESGVERRLQAEARVLASLEHPGIVPIHDAGRLADGRLFYVMKRVRGRTLREQLATVPDLGERLRIFERICEAVAFAHDAGVIHRDLKPDNVMIGAFGEVMVMDWGVAKQLGDAAVASTASGPAGGSVTEAGTVVGTPGFMAPEQARGDADRVDVRADVYSLGAILSLLLTGGDPGPGADALSSVAGRHDVPKPLRAICARALDPDPDGRYAAVTALADDIARYRSGEAVSAHRETVWEQTARLARAYRTALLLVLGYIVMRIAVALTAGW
jgi:eukaryotic-like serine/threonine-protein kinase